MWFDFCEILAPDINSASIFPIQICCGRMMVFTDSLIRNINKGKHHNHRVICFAKCSAGDS